MEWFTWKWVAVNGPVIKALNDSTPSIGTVRDGGILAEKLVHQWAPGLWLVRHKWGESA